MINDMINQCCHLIKRNGNLYRFFKYFSFSGYPRSFNKSKHFGFERFVKIFEYLYKFVLIFRTLEQLKRPL